MIQLSPGLEAIAQLREGMFVTLPIETFAAIKVDPIPIIGKNVPIELFEDEEGGYQFIDAIRRQDKYHRRLKG